jgi:hypothetical protein
MKPETPTEDPKPAANPPSLKMRLMGEAMIEAGEKNNEPSMVKTGKKILGL